MNDGGFGDQPLAFLGLLILDSTYWVENKLKIKMEKNLSAGYRRRPFQMQLHRQTRILFNGWLHYLWPFRLVGAINIV